ncbi:MAG: UTRA domain-containing protein [Acutalibacteraceae bacterium]
MSRLRWKPASSANAGAPGRVVRRLKRVRYGEKIPVAVEDNYFTQELYERIAGSAQSEASIAHVILTQEDLSVGKIDYSIVRRVPTEKEQAELRVLPNQRVLEMTRWLYFEGDEAPSNFVRFVMPEHFMDYPFAAMKRD